MEYCLLLTEEGKELIEVLLGMIRPKSFDVYIELNFNHGEEIWENCTHFRMSK